MSRNSVLLAATAFAATLALVTGCSSTADEPAAEETTAAGGLEQFEEAAFEEGQLTVYASAAESMIVSLIDGFMDEYPEISVDYFRAAGTALFNRFATEADAGSTIADVFMPTVQPAFVSDNPDWFVKLTDEDMPLAAEWPAEFRDDFTVQTTVEEIVVIVNSDNVKNPPKTWDDVLDEQYKGRIILVDPLASPGYMSWYAIAREAFGDEFLEGLAALDPVWVDTGATGAQQVATGQYDLVIPTYPSHAVALIDQGAPLELITNLDPTQGITTSIAITADAPNPNAARLFANWLLTPAAYEIWCGDPVYSATIEGTSCQPLASNYVEPKWDVSETEQNEIVALLGRG